MPDGESGQSSCWLQASYPSALAAPGPSAGEVGEAGRPRTIDQRLDAAEDRAFGRGRDQNLAPAFGLVGRFRRLVLALDGPHTRLTIMPATMPPRTLTIISKGL